MKELHPKQKKLVQLLQDNVENPLTIRELAERLGISSTSVVHHHISQLEKKGLLKRDPNNSSNYQVLSDDPDKQIAYLNLYGMAQCGPSGSILDGNPISRIPILTSLLSFPSREAFLVKARGDSMSPEINDGDYVIVRKSNDEPHGQVVVCVNNEEVLIKRLLVGQGGKRWLSSINQDNKYMPFPSADDFRVEGLVKGLLFRRI
jgi:repressor LexA